MKANLKRQASAMISGIVGVVLASAVSASELIYTPINPNFGGSPLNGSWLLNQAQVQDSFEDPDAEDDFLFDDETNIDVFRDSLNRLILSGLAGIIIDEVFDDIEDTGLDEGINTFTTDGFSITIDKTQGATLNVDIEDQISGDSTSLKIPYF
jgi:curli production assembly/transport component CsgF